MLASRVAASALAASTLIATPVLAKPRPHRHAPLSHQRAAERRSPASARDTVRPVVAAPSFGEAVAAAWALLPQRQAYDARQQTAAARYAAGGAYFPNAPYATGTFVNDKIAGSNYNYITSQGQFSTPLWLPGEGTATQAVAQADANAAAAEAEAAHHALALQVLDLAAQATAAVNARDVEARRLATAEALAASVAQRFKVGEAANSDALAAAADAAGVQVALSAAEAQIGTALASLAQLTGQDAIPRLGGDAAAASSTQRPPDSHPRIVAAERAVAAAEANARLVRIENRSSPEIGVQGINEKQPGTRWDTRFGVVFTLPFATEARNAPRRAAAEQQVTQARVQLELARRAVLAGLRQAEAELTGAERGLAAATAAAEQLGKRRGQIERAWKLGEMSLIELVRANALAYDAELAQAKARTGVDVARIRLRLAQGAAA